MVAFFIPGKQGKSLLQEASYIFLVLGCALILYGYVASFVIGFRVNKPLFAGMLLVWVAAYPFLLRKHWKESRLTLIALAIGLACLAIGLGLCFVVNPNMTVSS